MGNRLYHRAVVHRLAAPLLYDGCGRERKRLLWYHHNDYRHPDRGEDLQLAVHHVSGPHRVPFCDAVDIGFIVTFSVGGMTGVLLAVPGADFVLHNSLFLIAHFHNVIIGGVVFGCFAGMTYWWPKAFGFKLNETWGKRAFGSGSSASSLPLCHCTRWASWA